VAGEEDHGFDGSFFYWTGVAGRSAPTVTTTVGAQCPGVGQTICFVTSSIGWIAP
jgi:hypothetical protein